MPQVSSVEKRSKKVRITEERYDDRFGTQTGKKFIVYHTNWANYDRNYQVKDLPIDYIPEIAYAFFNVDEKGNIISGDSWADFEKRYTDPLTNVPPPDNWDNDSSNTVHGNFGQFLKLKASGKHFNLILSLGGWSWSKFFSSAVLPENREYFADNLIKFFDKYPIFTGVSLDWEYCTNDGKNYGNAGNLVRPQDSENFLEFCKILRTKLNSNGKDHYLISTCVSADPKIGELLNVKELSDFVDEFHIMTYDFMGFAGQKTTGHHTNLKSCHYCDFSIEQAVEFYLNQGIDSKKLFIGVATYSRGFSSSDGPGKSGLGGSLDTSWENGIVDYKNLPLPGSKEYWDTNCSAPFSYNVDTKVYNSYDNEASVYEKSKYVYDKNLGGIIVWESSGDHSIEHPRSLINALDKYIVKGDFTKEPSVPEIWGSSTPEVPVQTPEVHTEVNWEISKNYVYNDAVVYKEQKYICMVKHTSIPGWEPDVAQTLWCIDKENSSKDPVKKPEPILEKPVELCECMCKKIKSIKIVGNIDMSNIEMVYEE